MKKSGRRPRGEAGSLRPVRRAQSFQPVARVDEIRRAQSLVSGVREQRRLLPGSVRRNAAGKAGEAPGGWIGEERLEQAPVQSVARAHAAEMTEGRRTGEVEIAERVEHFVTHEL